MSFTLNVDTMTVALLEIVLFGLVVWALGGEGKLPLSVSAMGLGTTATTFDASSSYSNR